MFEGFAHVWTPVMLGRELGKQPINVTVAGESIALFRKPDGLGALIDRCPHRGVKLSLGQVTKDGCLECPFHGWQFDARGECQRVPFNPDAKRSLLRATALPVREVGGMIWLYTAPGLAAPELRAPEALALPGVRLSHVEDDWDTHWTRAMENMLDSPHLPFVHRGTIGKPIRQKMRADSVAEVMVEDRDYGARLRWMMDGNDNGAWLDFHTPNGMTLNIPIPGKVFRMHAWCVPMGPLRTRMIIAGARSFATAAVMDPFFNRSYRKILNEDRAVVESSQPPEVPVASAEHSVATDRGTLRFRRYYHEVLKGSAVRTAGVETRAG